MKRALAIRHLAFEDLGTLAPLLARRGFEISYHDAGIAEIPSLDAAQAELLVVLGGPIGAFDELDYPFLTAELALITQRLADRRPTLGICLGAQLMARALHAGVRAMGRKEIGFGPLTLTEAGRNSALSAMAPGTQVLHWHGDMFDIPEGAQWLAASAACPSQAFALGDHALGLQFHLEADSARLERWLIGHALELSVAGIAPGVLRAQARAHGQALRAASDAVFGQWLERIDRSNG